MNNITQPVKVIETSLAKIDVFPRPGYCDRGRFQPMTMDSGNHGLLKMVLNQYYFDLEMLNFSGMEEIKRSNGEHYDNDAPVTLSTKFLSTEVCLLQSFNLKKNSCLFWSLNVYPTVSPETGFNIDNQDGFPRFYSNEYSLINEADSWITKRNLNDSGWFNLELEHFPKN